MTNILQLSKVKEIQLLGEISVLSLNITLYIWYVVKERFNPVQEICAGLTSTDISTNFQNLFWRVPFIPNWSSSDYHQIIMGRSESRPSWKVRPEQTHTQLGAFARKSAKENSPLWHCKLLLAAEILLDIENRNFGCQSYLSRRTRLGQESKNSYELILNAEIIVTTCLWPWSFPKVFWLGNIFF